MDKPAAVKIVPKTRKKLLQQALMKDSPKNSSLLTRNFFHKASKSSVVNIENWPLCPQSPFLKSSPFQQREVNVKRIETFSEQGKTSAEWDLPGLDVILLKLWKCSRMRTELDEFTKGEIFQFCTSSGFQESAEKVQSFFNECKRVINKPFLPESLSPYLEEIICNTRLSFPLIKSSNTLSEAETLLFIPIIRFSKKKIQVILKQLLRKVSNPSTSLLKGLKILLFCLCEIETTIKKPSKTSKIWEIFLDLSSNPGNFTQTIRKLPENLRKNLIFSENQLKIQSSTLKLEEIRESPELFQLLSEIGQMFRVLEENHREKISRFKRIEKICDSGSSSSRARTPATSRVLPLTRRTHSRSGSNQSLTGRNSLKKEVFLQESRFNKRIAETFIQVLVKKMKEDPEYLKQVKREDFLKYLMFKTEFIEIHKESWILEATENVKNSQQSEGLGQVLGLADTKNFALEAMVSNTSFLDKLFLKAKKLALKV
jgi:hypothetical protein